MRGTKKPNFRALVVFFQRAGSMIRPEGIPTHFGVYLVDDGALVMKV